MNRLALLLLFSAALGGCSSCKRTNKVVPRVIPLDGGESAILPRVTRPRASAGALVTTRQAIAVGSRRRKYVLVAPAAPETKLPLVLVFHGDGGDADELERDWTFVAYPDGPDRWDLETKVGNEDFAFVEALIESLASRLPIDRGRVFLSGYSSGGFFANVFACHKSGLVRAIASNAGGAPYNQDGTWPNGYPKCPAQAPVATIALHGTDDHGVTLDSGRFSAEYWAYVNGCKTDELEPTGYDECKAYRGCPGGKAVAWCVVPGLGHWVWDRAAEASWTFFQRVSDQPMR